MSELYLSDSEQDVPRNSPRNDLDPGGVQGGAHEELLKLLRRYYVLTWIRPTIKDTSYSYVATEHCLHSIYPKTDFTGNLPPEFLEMINSPQYTLVLFEQLLVGFFIMNNDIIPFPTIEKLASPPPAFASSCNRGNGCRVATLPNCIPPHQVTHATDFPKYIRCISPKRWNSGFKSFVDNIDPCYNWDADDTDVD